MIRHLCAGDKKTDTSRDDDWRYQGDHIGLKNIAYGSITGVIEPCPLVRAPFSEGTNRHYARGDRA